MIQCNAFFITKHMIKVAVRKLRGVPKDSVFEEALITAAQQKQTSAY